MKPHNAPRSYCRVLIALIAFVAMAASTLLVSTSSSAAPPKKSKIDTPILSCGGSTQASINITVCAPGGTGATGLPAGFSLQWTTAAQFAVGLDGIPGTADDNTWPDSSLICHASFSGNANLSRYNLAPGECVTVNVGDFLFDEGTSTNCPDSLVCGTSYVFRAFGHATSTLNRSDFTGNLFCSTIDCHDTGGGCTYTQGYWKTHGPVGCLTGNNITAWPQSVLDNGMDLGNVHYNADQLCSIFNTPASGNGLISLAHQLIAAKLNVANGADATDAATCMANADALIGNQIVPPVGSGSLPSSQTSSLTTCLTTYNEGGSGPGHCQ